MITTEPPPAGVAVPSPSRRPDLRPDTVRRAGRGRHHVGRRRWPRRVLIGLNVTVAVCLVAVSSLYAYVSYRFGQIHRVTIIGLSIGAAPGAVHTTGGGSAGPPMNILVVGSDTRATLSDGSQFGGAAVGGARSDTIMIVHLDPAAGTAALLSIPRDLWVPVTGYGDTRINTAFNNGPDLLVRTIQDDLGIAINHYVDVDFDSFRQVVSALGGVKFWFPEPVRDNDNGVNDSGLNVTTPGCYTLTGSLALSLVRTRHLQYEDNGRWILEPQSDLARIRRQQLFIKKIVSRAQSLGLTNITKLNGVVGGVVSNLTVDSGFSESEMLSLARRYRNLNPSTIPTATLPTTPTVIAGADVLVLQKAPAQQVIDLWQGIEPPSAVAAPTTTPSTTPGTVTVAVSNGSGISHQAAAATSALEQAGYHADVAGSAASFGHQQSVIDYAPQDEAAAQALQARLVGGATLQADGSRTPGTLGLITGSSYGGVQAATATPAPTTPTTPTTPTSAGSAPASISAALAAIPGNTSIAPAFPGPHGQDPPPPGSGC